MLLKHNNIIVFLILTLILTSCLSYYRANQKFNNYFEQGEFQKAEQILDNDKRADKRNTLLLYYMNRGTISFLLGNHQESNEYFEMAYLLKEDFNKRNFDAALSLVSNPNSIPYQGEDFENLLVNYFKAINFLMLGNYEAALIECRRMNIRLNQLNDKYKGNNKYKRDGFIHNLMGIIYDATDDHNNAFIAYRNSYNIYTEDAAVLGVSVPEQLKYDLVRSAIQSGFREEAIFYINKFGDKYNFRPEQSSGRDLIFFWHNGLVPVKEEWSINFLINRTDDKVIFSNLDLGLVFEFEMNKERQKQSGLIDITFVRVAFPRYMERFSHYPEAQLNLNGKVHPLHLAQNINHIARQSLSDRMMLELGNALLRLAVKHAAEAMVRKESTELGTLVSIINLATEKADTRNWQTLPYSINYSRVPLGKKSSANLKFEILNKSGNQAAFTKNYDINAHSEGTQFFYIHTTVNMKGLY